MAKDGPALIVDGMSILRTVAGPATHLRNGYTYSFLIQVTSVVKKFKPSGIFVCWEGGFTERLKIHPEYKIDRKPTPTVIREYRDHVKLLMKHLGADQIHAPGYEADDVGAMLANTLEKAVLISNDKDWLQLVRPGVSVFQKTRREGKKNQKELITHDNFHEVTGFLNPQEYLKYHLAMGDGIDGVPGLPGIGSKTVIAYLTGLDMSETNHARLKEFFNGSPEYIRNKALIELTNVKELPLVVDPGSYDERACLNLLEELTFGSITKQFSQWILPYKEALP